MMDDEYYKHVIGGTGLFTFKRFKLSEFMQWKLNVSEWLTKTTDDPNVIKGWESLDENNKYLGDFLDPTGGHLEKISQHYDWLARYPSGTLPSENERLLELLRSKQASKKIEPKLDMGFICFVRNTLTAVHDSFHLWLRTISDFLQKTAHDSGFSAEWLSLTSISIYCYPEVKKDSNHKKEPSIAVTRDSNQKEEFSVAITADPNHKKGLSVTETRDKNHEEIPSLGVIGGPILKNQLLIAVKERFLWIARIFNLDIFDKIKQADKKAEEMSYENNALQALFDDEKIIWDHPLYLLGAKLRKEALEKNIPILDYVRKEAIKYVDSKGNPMDGDKLLNNYYVQRKEKGPDYVEEMLSKVLNQQKHSNTD